MGDEEVAHPFTVLVCGGGNAAQVATAMYAARYKTIAVSFFADEAAKWKAALGDADYELTLDTGKTLKSKPHDITNDPTVAKEADAIVLAVPSFAHGEYFEKFAPYMKPGCVVACMPARSGGDILFASKLGDKAKDMVFVGFETLPWACRFSDWGKTATILGTKGSILAAVTPPSMSKSAFAIMQGLLGVFPNVTYSPNNLGISLRNPGAVIHPGVMYGRWCPEKWDGNALAEKPLFYQGVEEFSESVLLGLTGEVQAIKNKLEEMIPGLDLKDAVDLKQWYLDCYAGQMTDTSSLRACMNTNPGYKGLTHPMKTQDDGKFMPDLKYRYLSEDVPTGMCFNKGLAELLGVPTPMTDKVLDWAQKQIGKEFLVQGKMAGKDVASSRAPQATGISTIDQFLVAAKINKSELAKTPKVVSSAPPPAETEEKAPFCVLVCGGGNAAQVATAMFASRYRTIAVSFFADEAARWKTALGSDEYELTLDTGKVLKAKPDDITNDASVAKDADAIVLAVPSFAHGEYFEKFAPYMKKNCVVACMPARSGGDILFASKLGDKAKDMVFMGFETLPWACRFTEWGRKATILGTKGSILAAVTPPSKYHLAYAILQGLLGVFPNVAESPNNLGISLRNPGAVIHPGVMYGRWCPEKWDGNPLADKPLFYQGVEEFSESVLLALTGEVQAIRKKMEESIPGMDLKDAVDLKQWYLDCYSGQMTDTSSLRACMNTNPGYKGLTHPMKTQDDGKFMPDLKYRYLSEDVPTGMCFNKGLAEILNIPTPMTDKVLDWAQKQIGLSILVDGKMKGPDIGKTRAPQATGITTLDGFCKAASIVNSSEEKANPFTVLVCGGGNAAQVAASMYASRYKTIAVSFFADEAAKWKAALGDEEYELTLDTGMVLKSKPYDITNDPTVATEADAIILAVPSFAHGEYFEKFAPYMKKGTVVACMPARSGGDILFASKLGSKAKDMVFVGFETLPWACRFTEWGKKATILGTKGSILAAVTPPSLSNKAFSIMQGLLGVFPNVTYSPNNLGISLRNPGAVIHPGVMYGRWCPEKWDGNALAEKPLFYQGVEEFSESVLLGLTGEVQAIKNKLEQLIPGLDLKDAVDLKQWYLDCYSGQMTDTSSLRMCMNTNPGYKGLTHPMKTQDDGKHMPDLKYRYIAEDVPTGMCFNKGLAEILGIPTPMTDKVLDWAQKQIGKEFLVQGKMAGKDIASTRAPQATGISTLEDFLVAAKIDKSELAKTPKQVSSAPPPAESEEKTEFCVLVCGGGNAAQVATAMFAARYKTIAVSFFADEAERWKKALGDDQYELTLDTGIVLKSKPSDITNDPTVAKEADAIVLAVPSFAHGEYFEKFAPYMKKNAVVACMPARSGGDILFASKLGDKAKDMVFMGFETLPWACRFTEWGKKATILGTKGSILAAVTPPSKFNQAFAILQGLLGVFPNVAASPNNLGISLRNPGAVIHPGVMYGRWCPEKWDGNPLVDKPLFYQGVEEFSESVLLGLTQEVQAIKWKMEKLIPGLNLSDAVDLKQWYLDCYSGQMTDTSSLRYCMNTNPGYRGLTHPMKTQDDGKFMPDLRYRYLTEDVPTGMCFNKGLAEILGIKTPMTDKVLDWAQKQIGLEILVDGKMNGKDIAKTRAPQATGISTLEQFKQAASILPGERTYKVVFLRHGESVWNVANIFTGWADVDLSPAGEMEAVEAGKCLKEKGYKFDVVFTSVLRRSIKTAWVALMESDNFTMPIFSNWRLNERHYGGLQGLNKAETAKKHGDDQVKIWRRSYDIPPPQIPTDDKRHPCHDPLYAGVPTSALPGAESLKLTVDRVLPFWFDHIAPCILAGKLVLVAAHGNSLRAICKYLEGMSEKDVLELNIPTAVPLVYELDSKLNFIKKYYLMDPDEVAKKMAAVANQGKAK